MDDAYGPPTRPWPEVDGTEHGPLSQTSHKTHIVCDIQKETGSSWRSVYIARTRDGVENPNRAAREWLAQNREPGTVYRIVRTVTTHVLTVDPI